LVSQHSSPSLVDTIVILMQYLDDTPLILESDASFDLVISCPFQKIVEKLVMPMQSLVDPNLLLESDKSKEVTLSMQYLVNATLILGGDAYFNHVLIISSYVPCKKDHSTLSEYAPSKFYGGFI
jgi:hypothetical protein